MSEYGQFDYSHDYGTFPNGWKKIYHCHQDIIDGIPYVDGQPNFVNHRLYVEYRKCCPIFYHFYLKPDWAFDPDAPLSEDFVHDYCSSVDEAIGYALAEQARLLSQGQMVPIYYVE